MDIDEILYSIRRSQNQYTKTESLLFVLEYISLIDPKELDLSLRRLLDLEVIVTFLFNLSKEDSELGRYFLLEIPDGKAGISRAEIFKFSYYLLDELRLRSCEPDIESDFAFEAQLEDRVETFSIETFSGDLIGCRVNTSPPGDPLWALKNMRVFEAWNVPLPDGGRDRGEGIRIGQIDTGVNEHTELDRDALDLRHGANFIEGGAALPIDPLVNFGPADNPGHGISTASVAISRDLAGDVITGTAPKATIVPVRSIRSVIRLSQRTVAQGVDYARQQGVDVITMSLGGLPSFALRSAIRRAVADNIIVLAAAGNCVRTVTYPARFRDCIAISGTNIDDRPWIGACRGSAVDLCAPAEQVYNAYRSSPDAPPDGTSDDGQGTSFAVALTAGVAALWLAHFGRSKLIDSLQPGETLQERFRSLLRHTARIPDSRTWDFVNFGQGIVDAKSLLEADPFKPLSSRFSTRAFVNDEEEIAEEVGPILAELAGLRNDHLGLNTAQRSRFYLELTTMALCDRRSSQELMNNADLLSLSPSFFSAELCSSFEQNASATLRHWINKRGTVSSSGDDSNLRILDSQRDEEQIANLLAREARSFRASSAITSDRFTTTAQPKDKPFQRTLRLKMRRTGTRARQGTGWLVGPSTIITAAHNIVRKTSSPDDAVLVDSISIIRSEVTLRSKDFDVHPEWVSSEFNPNYDIGVVYLDSKIGNSLGIFQAESLSDSELKGIDVLTTAGYPILSSGIVANYGQIIQPRSRRIFYDLETDSGQSGSPVWYVNEASGQSIVIGMHTNNEGETPAEIRLANPGKVITSGIRMTEDIIDLINRWKV